MARGSKSSRSCGRGRKANALPLVNTHNRHARVISYIWHTSSLACSRSRGEARRGEDHARLSLCIRGESLTMFVIADVRRGMCALYHYALLPITYLVTPYISYIILDTPEEKVRILSFFISFSHHVSFSFSLAPYATDETLGPLPCTSARISRARTRVRITRRMYVHIVILGTGYLIV